MLDLKVIFDPDRPVPAPPPAPAGTPAELPADWHQLWDERAAIMEYEGGLPRELAEAMALVDIIQTMERAGAAIRYDT